MTLQDLIDACRSEAVDTATPYLWSDADWIRYANDAQREACRRARLIVDSTTTAICRIAMVAATASYALDSRVLFIKRAKLSGRSLPLSRASHKDLDRSVPGWEDATGEPQAYVPDMNENEFRPYPTPTTAATVSLTVIRLPLADMALAVVSPTTAAVGPEIKACYHESLVFWMLYRAYSKQDTETLDKKKAADNLALFEAEFGKKSTAVDETWTRREHGYTEDEGVY